MTRISVAGGYVQNHHGTKAYRSFVDALSKAQVDGITLFEELPLTVQAQVLESEAFVNENRVKNTPSRRNRSYAA